MVGPSASGSLNGTPTSMMSETSAAEISAALLASRVGKPAVRYGISPERPLDRRVAQASSSRDSDKVVANREPEAVRVRDLHDRSPKRPTLVLFAEAGLDTGQRHRTSFGIKGNTHHGAVELLTVRAGA